MDFAVGDDERAMLEVAERLAGELRTAARESERSATIPSEAAERHAALGLARIDWPEARGGAGLSTRLALGVLDRSLCATAAAAVS